MKWFISLFSFEGTAKRSELIRTIVACAFFLWLGALVDERIIGPYLCSQDPLRIGCIPGEVKTQFEFADYIGVIAVMIPITFILLAAMVRRLRDYGKSRWWLLAAFTGIGLLPLLYWFLMRAPKSEAQ